MARRKYEFKPDRQSRGLLNKLYMTPKQRLTLLRWSLVAVVLLVLSLLQDVILCRLDVFGATTDLVPCAIFLVCMLLSVETGCVFALVSACLYQFSGGPGYHSIVIITVLAIGVSMLRQSYLRKSFFSSALGTALCLMIYELVVFIVAVALGQTYLGRIHVPLITGTLSLLLLPVLYPVIRAIEKIGGEQWKD